MDLQVTGKQIDELLRHINEYKDFISMLVEGAESIELNNKDIRDFCFHNQIKLKEITLNNVEKLGYSFAGCENLEKVIIKNNESICQKSFKNSPYASKSIHYDVHDSSADVTTSYTVSIPNINGGYYWSASLAQWDTIKIKFGEDIITGPENTNITGKYLNSTDSDWTESLYWKPSTPNTLITSIPEGLTYHFVYFPSLNKLIISVDAFVLPAIVVPANLVSQYKSSNDWGVWENQIVSE